MITSAGLGTRLGSLCNNLNKAMVNVGNKPIISHIIEKFPKDVEIVVAVGYKKDPLIQYLDIAYDNRKITVVEVDKFDGDGAGLGYTVLQCKDHLQCPFIFTSNDTLVTDTIRPPEENWVGYAYLDDLDPYRTISKDGDNVIALLEKRQPGKNLAPYIGLAGIKDYEIFWEAMETGKSYGSITEGESYGIRSLIEKSSVKAIPFSWYDTGNVDGLNKARKTFGRAETFNILEKTSEDIWFTNNKVIKYSEDPKFIHDRVERSRTLGNYLPTIEGSSENIYSYKKISGKVLSSVLTIPKFSKLLSYMQDFWSLKHTEVVTKEDCLAFYKDKTIGRVKKYFDRYPNEPDQDTRINGVFLPSMSSMLNMVDWDSLCDPTPSVIHGDLHFENVIYGEDGDIHLIDWRQNFGHNLNAFDRYYDYAKLNHGMVVSHEKVMNNEFTIDIQDSIINLDIPISIRHKECQDYFREYILDAARDWKKIERLTALVFINNAPLHHDGYSNFLFYLGKYLLWKHL